MRTIYSLLAEIEKNALVDMELTEDLSALLTILSTFNDHVKPFKNIQMIEDNDRYVSELKQRILYFLKQRGYWDTHTDSLSIKQDNQNTLRKFCLFLVYNTDTDKNNKIESGQNVCHLVGHFPRLPKCVLFYLIRELKMFRYFSDFIQFGPSDVIVAYLDSELLFSLKQMDCYDRLEILPVLISGVYHHCYLSAFESCVDKDSREGHFEVINDFLSTLFLSHVHANREKFPELKTQLDFDTFIGQLLRQILRAIIKCLETYLSKSNGLDMEVFPVFQIDKERKINKEFTADDFLEEYLTGMNSLVLNRVQMVLMTVSCNTFLNWMEVDLSKTVTLQRAVGELVYHLMDLLATNESLNHDIQSVLKGVSVKPLNAEEIAKEANIAEVMEHIEDKEDRDRAVWMREFVSRGLFVLDNEECLSVISDNSQLLSIADLKLLTEFLKDNVGTELSNLPQIVDIIAKVLSSTDNVQEVETFLETEEPFRVLMDYDLIPDKYFQELTKFLNQLVDLNEEEKMKISSVAPFITALMIDPTKAITEVQNNCIRDTNLVENGLKVLSVLRGFVSGFMEDIVKELLESRIGEADSLKGLELYVVEVFSRGFVDREEFLKNTLFPEIMKKSQEKENSVQVLSLLGILKGVTSTEKYSFTNDLRAPFIVGLGQVANAHRWDLLGYTDTEEKIVSLATELIGCVGGGAVIDGKHKSFIVHKSQDMKEINRYYIEKLFPENADTTFVRYIHAAPFQSDKNRRDFLVKTFVRATMAEKELLSDCVELQPHFVEMMLIIAKAVSGHEKLLGGFRGTFSGFLKIFKEKLVDSLSCESLSLFVELISNIPVDIYVDQTFVVNGIITKILERSTENEEVRINILLKIKQFKESSAKSHLLEQVKME